MKRLQPAILRPMGVRCFRRVNPAASLKRGFGRIPGVRRGSCFRRVNPAASLKLEQPDCRVERRPDVSAG